MPLAIDAGHSDKEGTSEECRKFKGRVVDLHWYQLFNRTMKEEATRKPLKINLERIAVLSIKEGIRGTSGFLFYITVNRCI